MKQDAAIGLRQYAVGTARNMEAGGPGSGRHSEGGAKPVHSGMHKVLTGLGFKHQGNSAGGAISTYTHPNFGTVKTASDGEFSHSKPSAPYGSMGYGTKDLKQYAKDTGWTASSVEARETAEHQPPRGPVPTGPRKKSLLQKTYEEKDQEYYPDSKLAAGGPGSGRHSAGGGHFVEWDHNDPATHAFGKLYLGRTKEGGGGPKSDKFDSAVKSIGGKSGFGGSGHTIYQHEGNTFRVDRGANGKGFYGTDHMISKIEPATMK